MAVVVRMIFIVMFSSYLIVSCKIEPSLDTKKEAYQLGEKALIYAQSLDIDKAIETMKEALDKYPRSPMLNDQMGAIYSLKGNLAESCTYYNKAIEIEYRYASAYKGLAENYRELNNDKLSKFYYKLFYKYDSLNISY